METGPRSGGWKWVWRVLVALALTAAVVVGLVVVAVVVGVVTIGEALSSDTTVTIQPRTVNERVEFDLTYGKSVTGLSVFVVQDADGNDLWKLSGHSDVKPPKVVYGVVPNDPVGAWQQEFPTDGKPADIRGRHVKVEADCRFIVALGAGHESTRAEFDIPK